MHILFIMYTELEENLNGERKLPMKSEGRKEEDR